MLVSIIVPIFNSESTLTRCLDSILRQTYENFELILVNDGSKDGSLQICEQYEKKDSRISVIDQPNSGVSKARNEGLKNSKGDVISFIDSDDYIDRDFYEFLVEQFKKSKADAIALSKYTIKKSELRDETLDTSLAIKNLLKLKLPSSVWAYLYSAKTIKNLKFANNIHFFEDVLFNYQFFCKVKRIKLCSYNGYHYTSNPDSANNIELSEKKLSCLLIPEFIDKEETEISFFYAHCLISIILSMAKSKKSIKKYGDRINQKCKDFIPRINKSVPLDYILVIFSAAYFPKITNASLRILKGRNKND